MVAAMAYGKCGTTEFTLGQCLIEYMGTRVPLKLQNDVLSISQIKPGRVKDNDSNA